mmetsp:Transcript_20538/g.55281  ORF Transcript_20538/g.55281 Transcript_20538/m.55281 type:complete len:354 (+) Transcript_20538:225-1286(+)
MNWLAARGCQAGRRILLARLRHTQHGRRRSLGRRRRGGSWGWRLLLHGLWGERLCLHGDAAHAKGIPDGLGRVRRVVHVPVPEGADKDGFDDHLIDGSKDAREEEGDDDGDHRAVARVGVAVRVDPVVADESRDEGDGDGLEQLEHKLHQVVDVELRRVLHDEDKGGFRRIAEAEALDGGVDVGVARDELEALLQTPHAALDALEHQPGHEVGVLELLGALVHVLEYDAQELGNGDDERPEGHGAEVEAHHGLEAREDGERGVELGVVAEEEPLRHAARHHHHHRAHDEGEGPERAEEVVREEGVLRVGGVTAHHRRVAARLVELVLEFLVRARLRGGDVDANVEEVEQHPHH